AGRAPRQLEGGAPRHQRSDRTLLPARRSRRNPRPRPHASGNPRRAAARLPHGAHAITRLAVSAGPAGCDAVIRARVANAALILSYFPIPSTFPPPPYPASEPLMSLVFLSVAAARKQCHRVAAVFACLGAAISLGAARPLAGDTNGL